MKSRGIMATLACTAALLAVAPHDSRAQSATSTATSPPPFSAGPAAPVGEMKSLGGDRYQIGRIVVDKKARRFTVPGRVHVVNLPLEYLATTPGGRREYETLLEVDATGSEFNLACILLGLERDPSQKPYYQFSEEPLSGPRVKLHVAWQEGGKRREISAAQALLDPKNETKPESVEWVYMGSLLTPDDGLFAADVTGSLVGFVHNPSTIIESVRGLGIGAYGAVAGNTDLLPPTGSPIELVVEVPREAKPASKP